MIVYQGIWRKLRVWFDLGPGYNYFLLHYDPTIKGIPPPAEKLTPATVPKLLISVPNKQMERYALMQFGVMAVMLMALLVLNSPKNPGGVAFEVNLGLLVCILLHQMSLGALFDRKTYAPSLEIFANIANLLFVIFIVDFSFGNAFFLAATVFTVASSTWVALYQREEMELKGKPKLQ